MSAYADLTYYQTNYLGTLIASANFAQLALRASAVIDQLTFQRTAAVILAATDTATIDLIKMACCAVAEEMQNINASGSTGGIKSESIGSNSVTYVDGSQMTLSNNTRLSNVAKLYLGNSGLMFKGFSSDELSGDLNDDEDDD
jgi:hypothetical protein